jgi:hypothetical protein
MEHLPQGAGASHPLATVAISDSTVCGTTGSGPTAWAMLIVVRTPLDVLVHQMRTLQGVWGL